MSLKPFSEMSEIEKSQTAVNLAILVLYEDGSGGFRNTYDRVIAYTAPRSVRFSVAYEHKF